MKIFIVLLALFVSGCLFGENSTTTRDDRGNVNKEIAAATKTTAPAPVFSTGDISVGKSGCLTLTVPTPQPAEETRNVTANMKDKWTTKFSETIQSGWFYLILAVSFLLVIAGYIAWTKMTAAGAATDTALAKGAGVVKAIGDSVAAKLAKAVPGTPEWNTLDDLKDEVDYHAPKFWKDRK